MRNLLLEILSLKVHPLRMEAEVKMAELLPLKNTELNGLREIICLRKPEVSVERSVCNIIEELVEHGALFDMLLIQ